MLHSIASCFATLLCRNETSSTVIKKDIYVYGFELLISTFLSAGSILVFSIIFSRFVYGCTFLLIYIFFRMVCGGYHAKTYIRCYWSSLAIFLAVVYIAHLVHNKWILFGMAFFYSIVIAMWAPIANDKHPLSYRAVLRNRIYALCMMVCADFWVVYRISIDQISDMVCFTVTSITAVAVLMIISKIQERRKNHECVDSNHKSC